ncbi:MAG: hypothetical protein KGZ65_15665 [Sphingomonadales bacterium]|nr:hypothetical protein [Sphingomonadaceae bacterium]MBS3932660.1 hypothetical protein [Sphingomonadales bacterium]
MALIFLFILGIGNFAAHKAVLESHHPLLERVPLFYQLLGGRFSLLVEFAMLLGAMLMVAQGSFGWALFYGVYTAFNAFSAWLIISGRI